MGVTVRTAGVIDIDGNILLKVFLAVLDSHCGSKAYLPHAHLQLGMQFSLHIYFLRTGISDFDVVVHIDSCCFVPMKSRIASTGLTAVRMAPLTAMPRTPVDRMESTSSRVMPPMATTGRWMPAVSIHCSR